MQAPPEIPRQSSEIAVAKPTPSLDQLQENRGQGIGVRLKGLFEKYVTGRTPEERERAKRSWGIALSSEGADFGNPASMVDTVIRVGSMVLGNQAEKERQQLRQEAARQVNKAEEIQK